MAQMCTFSPNLWKTCGKSVVFLFAFGAKWTEIRRFGKNLLLYSCNSLYYKELAFFAHQLLRHKKSKNLLKPTFLFFVLWYTCGKDYMYDGN